MKKTAIVPAGPARPLIVAGRVGPTRARPGCRLVNHSKRVAPCFSFPVWAGRELEPYNDYGSQDLLAAVRLPAGRSYDIVSCRRQREETRWACKIYL